MNRPLLLWAIILVLLPCGAQCQKSPQVTDSAELIMNRYMDLMNFDAIRMDSILYMETYIYYMTRPNDTAILKRWYLPPNMHRAELWHGDTLLEGAYTDGKAVFREYNKELLDGWTRIAMSRYYNIAPGYDFRGPMYNWKANGSELTFKGMWKFEGNDIYRILVETPDKYNRYLLFEKESGLLFLIEETNQHSEYSNHKAYAHPDLHAYHEYQPIGTVLLPSVESYKVDGDVLFHYTHYQYIKKDLKIFTAD